MSNQNNGNLGCWLLFVSVAWVGSFGLFALYPPKNESPKAASKPFKQSIVIECVNPRITEEHWNDVDGFWTYLYKCDGGRTVFVNTPLKKAKP